MTDLYDDAAVNAAVIALFKAGADGKRLAATARDALDAVAPLIAAKALRSGQAAFERAADMAENQTGRTLNLVVAEAFGKRADEIGRGE